MENTNTQPQAFYTKMPSAGDNTGKDITKKTPTPRKTSRFKMISGVVILLLIVFGSGIGLYLSQQSQDIRQQADVGGTLNRCETCNTQSGPTCSEGLTCKGQVSETCSTPTDGTIPICTSVASIQGFCLVPGETSDVCEEIILEREDNFCATQFSVPQGDAVCDSKIAQEDFTVNGEPTQFPDPGLFNVGDTFVFSITVTANEDTSGNVIVRDVLPNNLIFVEDPDNTPGILVIESYPITLDINLGEMTKDQTEKVEFRVEVISTIDTLATNSAAVVTNEDEASSSSCNYSYDTLEGTAECISKEMYDIDPADPDAEIIADGSALIRGEEYAYLITVSATNKTNGEVKVYDVIPEGLEFVRALPGYEQYILNDAGDNTILANLGVLEDEEVTLGFVVRVIDEVELGDLTNSALIYIYPPNSEDNEPLETGSTCEVSHTILPIGTAQCIEKEAFTDFDGTEIVSGERINASQEFIYRITIQADNTTTGNVVVVDQLPIGLIFVEDDGNTEGIEYDSETRQVTMDYGIIEDGEEKTIEFKVQVIANPTGDSLNNIATVTTDTTTSHVCELSLSLSTEEEEYACNEACETNANCQEVNDNYVCHVSDDGNVCRLDSNLESTDCSPATTPTPTPTPPVTPTPGCNEVCTSNANCSNSSHVCVTTADGSNKCRLEDYPESSTCTIPLAPVQPELPPTLPETGPEDWLNWLKAGLVTLGVGTALFLLL